MIGVKAEATLELYDGHPRPHGYFPFGAPYQKRNTVTRWDNGKYSCDCEEQNFANGLTNCSHMIKALCTSPRSIMWRKVE